jgi:hypothetical protein
MRSVKFSDFRFECTGKPVSLNINSQAEGDVGNRFSNYSRVSDFEIIQKSFSESADRISVPAAYIQKITDYSAAIRCK